MLAKCDTSKWPLLLSNAEAATVSKKGDDQMKRSMAVQGCWQVLARIKFTPALATAICLAAAVITASAQADSVEIAKKCSALMAKAFPPREPGNPAAGSAKGTGLDEQAYFKKCVANGGKVDDSAPNGGNSAPQGDNSAPKAGNSAPKAGN
jgi:hypothetical protein